MPDVRRMLLPTVGHRVYFARDAGANGRQIWRSDGTKLGTVQATGAKTIAPGTLSPFPMWATGDRLFFITRPTSGGSAVDTLWSLRPPRP